jgi:hypothetical protein
MFSKRRGKTRKSNRGDALHQSTFYACMEISQQNPFVQLTYVNKIFKLKKCSIL